MKGPPPKPTILKILSGNPGKRRLPKDEPRPPVCRPDPPDMLSAEARKHWTKIVGQLADSGIMTALDEDALAAYCEAFARLADANAKLAKFGSVIKNEDGMPRCSPYLRVANEAFQQMRVLLSEFGLTPASRVRIRATPKEETENPFAQFDRSRKA